MKGETLEGAKAWSDKELTGAIQREVLGFEDLSSAMEDARRRWALFERLRDIPGDYSSWADLPAQEAFEDLSSRGFEAALARGDVGPREPDSLPIQVACSVFKSAPVSAAGQGGGDTSKGSPFPCEWPVWSARSGDESLAQQALDMGLAQASQAVRRGHMDPEELALSFEARAARVEPGLCSLERLCSQQTEVGEEHGATKEGALAGMPFAAKSLFWVRGEIASASSRMLSRFAAPADAPVIAGLRGSGARPWAMARMDEFAMGGDGSRSAWGATAHPFHAGRLPGGSSSGSAAALAAGLCMFSIGSDTGGSVRIPASHCGLWGLKPTYGALSRFGMVPYAFSLDCPGAFARSADDLAMVYEAMASGPTGWDVRQKVWSPAGLTEAARSWAREACARSPERPWLGLRVGVERSWIAGCDGPAKEAFALWEQRAKEWGALVVDVELPMAQKAVWAYYLLVCCEAQSSLARYDPARLGWEEEAMAWPDWEAATVAARSALIGREPRMRALLGAMALSESSRESLYAKACGLRRALSVQWAQAFESVDMVACPTTAGPPPLAGIQMPEDVEWAQDRLAIPASLGGICAVSAPWAKRSDGFDMGIQLCAPWHAERRLLGFIMAWPEEHS